MELLISNHVNNIWILGGGGVNYTTSNIILQLSLPNKNPNSTSDEYLILSITCHISHLYRYLFMPVVFPYASKTGFSFHFFIFLFFTLCAGLRGLCRLLRQVSLVLFQSEGESTGRRKGVRECD